MDYHVRTLLFVLACCVVRSEGHGRLLEPPSRSSMFRYAYTDPALLPYKDIIQPNFDDNGLNCGGLQTQTANDGKCGVCGDSYTATTKENEAGGKYALGIITRSYEVGQVIDATVEITAEHKGYFEFRLCPWNNVNLPVTQECLDQQLLTFENGDTKWYLPEDSELAKGFHSLRVVLPSDITCQQCVLQWRYRAGNSWGTENGVQGLGMGQQEEFYGCSDVSVGYDSGNSQTNQPQTTPPYVAVTSNAPATSTSTSTIIEPEISVPPTLVCDDVDIIGVPVFRDCHSFFMCAHQYHDPFVFLCPDGTACDVRTGRCDHHYNVPYPCGTL